MFGRFLAMVVCAAGLATGAAAQCFDAPDLAAYQTATATDFALGPTRSDRLGRVVAPILVNGQGPFRFIVDTGANRSVLSLGLAEQLGLAPHGEGEVHGVHGVSIAPLVDVHSLQYGGLALGGATMPLLQGRVLAGEAGLLGVDGMRGRRLRMDFERNCIEIVPADRARRLRGWTAIRGELRFGHLVVVRGRVEGIDVNLLIDTGSDSSLANTALRDALNARLRRTGNGAPPVAYTANETVVLDRVIMMPRLFMGDLTVRNVTAFVGDFHIFNLWELQNEPTLLVGMDVLSQARGIAIDYQRSVVYFDVPGGRDFISRIRN